MKTREKYHINLDNKYGYLKLVDIPKVISECRHDWFNQTLSAVNDTVVRLGIIEGEFHWHKHDHEDEFFLVLEGLLHIDIEESDSVTLSPHQGYTIPKGIVHRTRAPERTVILMVEGSGVIPTGD